MIMKSSTQRTKRRSHELESVFKKAKGIKPKHNLTPAEMDELNDDLFR